MKKMSHYPKLMALLFCSMLHMESKAQNWNELGTGTNALNANAPINALCIDGSGNIYAAGFFGPNQSKWGVAKWNGTTWSMLGDGLSIPGGGTYHGISALAADASGNVYATGDILDNLGNPYVAKWNGTSWSQITYSETQGNSFALCADASNNVYAGSGGTTSGSNIFKVTGTTLTGIGSCNSTIIPYVTTLTSDASGNLYACGSMFNNLGYTYVTKWTGGTTWQELGAGANALNANDDINAITTGASGNVYAAGAFKNNLFKHYVAKWNGTTWSQLGDFTSIATNGQDIYALTEDANGDLLVAGDFYINGTLSDKGVVKWNGSSWSQLGDALPGNITVKAMIKDASGNIYIAGTLQNASGKYYVAKYNYTANATSVQVHTQNNVPATITQNNGTLQMVANVLPANAVQSVTWGYYYDTNNSLPATVSATGLVTATSNGTIWIKATSVANPSKMDSVKVIVSNQGGTGISEMEASIGFKLYPNPTTENIMVVVDESKSLAATINIADISGNVVRTLSAKGSKTSINIKDLPSGIYILKYQNDTACITRKFTKI